VVGGQPIAVVAYQVVAWAAIARSENTIPPPHERFPVVIDTGFSGTFAIGPNQLARWAGIAWNTLLVDPTLNLEYNRVPVPHRRADLWMYPNLPGERDQLDPLLPPFHLRLDGGIAVYGDGVQVGVRATAQLVAPRLPLLGLRAFIASRARLSVDAGTRLVDLDAP
jgi:hypothetical protein